MCVPIFSHSIEIKALPGFHIEKFVIVSYNFFPEGAGRDLRFCMKYKVFTQLKNKIFFQGS